MLFAASTDPPEKNREFAESLELDYPILSDPARKTARAYGALTIGLLPRRRTIYLGPDAHVLHLDDAVRTGHAGDDMVGVLDRLAVPRAP